MDRGMQSLTEFTASGAHREDRYIHTRLGQHVRRRQTSRFRCGSTNQTVIASSVAVSNCIISYVLLGAKLIFNCLPNTGDFTTSSKKLIQQWNLSNAMLALAVTSWHVWSPLRTWKFWFTFVRQNRSRHVRKSSRFSSRPCDKRVLPNHQIRKKNEQILYTYTECWTRQPLTS
jgi:hypothetical protein